MKLKINKGLLPIKAHFFFFFAALGPILPQINVYGRQLGVSPAAMGLVTAVLPLLWATAKPLFGYVVDFWPQHRKLVFMLLIIIMSGSYCCLWFLPMPEPETNEQPVLEYVYKLNDTVYLKRIDDANYLEKYNCRWNCSMVYFDVYLLNTTFINTMYVNKSIDNSSCTLLSMDMDDVRDGELTCLPKTGCNLLCYEEGFNATNIDERLNVNSTHDATNRTKREVDNHIAVDLNKAGISEKDIRSKVAKQAPPVTEAKTQSDYNFYMTSTFWAFVVLSCVGTVAFNVANCIGDAVCFDVLGPEHGAKYGAQRAWGTAGYGITALLGGWLVDMVSKGNYKDFTPAFVVAMAATAVDLYSCRALTLPSLSSPSDSGAALRALLRMPKVLMFIVFAVLAGTFDSFIIYYMFWFLEELAEETGSMGEIKLIEGAVVAAECLIGELLFFFFSGKIIKRIGYGNTLTVALFCYGIKLALTSVIQHPWQLVVVSAVTQGPTYALCYATIVGYAAQLAPDGYSATVQGIVAGMDDGVGFALGSLVGGQLYSWVGGRRSFQVMAVVAVISSAAHWFLFAYMNKPEPKEEPQEIVEEGQKMLQEHNNTIYQETVVPLKSDR